LTTFNTILAVLATISLFLFSLKGFSKELQKLGSERLQRWLTKVTSNRFSAFFLGAVLTAVIQSSSVVTSITVALVDAGVIGFFNSLGVLIGANVGTSFTAWLVAFKLSNLGSWFLVIGMGISLLPHRLHLVGKSVFYLGLILFSLQLINESLEPLSHTPEFLKWLSHADTLYIGILGGMLVTALLQSSSVTTGLTIILAGQGVLELPGAIAIVIGSNLGTTSTAMLASISLSKWAKNVAFANLLLNLFGLIVFLPLVGLFTRFIESLDLGIMYQIAVAHLLFNLTLALVALALLTPFSKLVLRMAQWHWRRKAVEGVQS
jgi:phosphate:Na+ symporter